MRTRFMPSSDLEVMAIMPTDTITLDAELKARLANIAAQAGKGVDEYVEALLRPFADADIYFENGLPVFPQRPGAPTVTSEDVNRILNGPDF